MTARNVFQGVGNLPPRGLVYGLCVKSQDATASNMFALLQGWERAPEPCDIAIGKVDGGWRSWFSLPEVSSAAPWLDVATLGYPETALNAAAGNFQMHARMLKGYIQRLADAGEIELIAPHPDCYELSFPVTSGMSGAPLFAAEGDRQELLGVCVGSYSAEVTEYHSTLVEDDGRCLEERSVKVEQIGIAESLFPLFEWTPKIADGRSLAGLIAPSETTLL